MPTPAYESERMAGEDFGRVPSPLQRCETVFSPLSHIYNQQQQQQQGEAPKVTDVTNQRGQRRRQAGRQAGHSRPPVERGVQPPPQLPLVLRPHGGLHHNAVAPRVANRQFLGRHACILSTSHHITSHHTTPHHVRTDVGRRERRETQEGQTNHVTVHKRSGHGKSSRAPNASPTHSRRGYRRDRLDAENRGEGR